MWWELQVTVWRCLSLKLGPLLLVELYSWVNAGHILCNLLCGVLCHNTNCCCCFFVFFFGTTYHSPLHLFHTHMVSFLSPPPHTSLKLPLQPSLLFFSLLPRPSFDQSKHLLLPLTFHPLADLNWCHTLTKTLNVTLTFALFRWLCHL